MKIIILFLFLLYSSSVFSENVLVITSKNMNDRISFLNGFNLFPKINSGNINEINKITYIESSCENIINSKKKEIIEKSNYNFLIILDDCYLKYLNKFLIFNNKVVIVLTNFQLNYKFGNNIFIPIKRNLNLSLLFQKLENIGLKPNNVILLKSEWHENILLSEFIRNSFYNSDENLFNVNDVSTILINNTQDLRKFLISKNSSNNLYLIFNMLPYPLNYDLEQWNNKNIIVDITFNGRLYNDLITIYFSSFELGSIVNKIYNSYIAFGSYDDLNILYGSIILTPYYLKKYNIKNKGKIYEFR